MQILNAILSIFYNFKAFCQESPSSPCYVSIRFWTVLPVVISWQNTCHQASMLVDSWAAGNFLDVNMASHCPFHKFDQWIPLEGDHQYHYSKESVSVWESSSVLTSKVLSCPLDWQLLYVISWSSLIVLVRLCLPFVLFLFCRWSPLIWFTQADLIHASLS